MTAHRPLGSGARFRDELLAAVSQRRTGELEAFSNGDEVGAAVMIDGRLAWASCRYQPEDLGSFLRRLGHVSNDQLARASATYADQEGRTKLGRILEDDGVVSRPVLRRCLQLHLRMALSCLLRDERLIGLWTEGGFTSDEELTFTLDEVFPELQRTARKNDVDEDGLSFSFVLEELGVTPGYRSSVIADSWGTALGVHGDATDDPLLASVLATAAATLVESGRNTVKRSGLGDLDFLMVEGEHGSATVRWADRDRRYLLAVFLEANGQTGFARHRLAVCAEKIQKAITESTEDME